MPHGNAFIACGSMVLPSSYISMLRSTSATSRCKQDKIPLLRPQPIVAGRGVPLWRRLEVPWILGDQVRPDRVLVDLEAQPWRLRHGDVAALDDRPSHAADR